MSFNPKPSKPKAYLDRWVIVANSIEAANRWIKWNFLFHRIVNMNNSAYIVSPRFDPTDLFEIHVISNSTQLYGLNFYEVIDIRDEKAKAQDIVLIEHSITNTLRKRLAEIRPPNVYQSPHPDPRPSRKEDYYDYTYLRRYWVSPDPIIHQELDDQCSTFDGPEWLAPQKRLR